MRFTKAYMMILKRIAITSIALVMLCLSACSSPSGEQLTLDEIPKYTLPPVEQKSVPIQGGELVFPIPLKAPTFNPLEIKNVELYNLFTLIYEKPIKMDVDGKPIPELVETWEHDSTGMIWTFNLRKGVQWQRGYGEFTSEDVVYTMNLIKNYKTSDSVYARYNNQIASYEPTDKYKVTVTLNEPGNAAIYYMMFPVLCKAYCESGNIDNLIPVGTGPYVAMDFDKDKQAILQASDVWWKEAPYIQKLTATCYPDHDAELASFDLNLLDFITTSILTVENYQKYGETVVVDYLTQYYDCLVPNASTGIFSDVNMRQAIAYALDKRDIISKALLGHAVAADYPIPLDSYLSGGSTNIYEYNLQKAVELLDESGWKDRDDDGIFENVIGTEIYDLEFELIIPENKEDTYQWDVAENIQTQLSKCGMDIKITEYPYDEYIRKLNSRNFELALCSFYLDINPDPSFMLKTGETANYGGFYDTKMDSLLDNCKTAFDEESMVDAYLALEDYFVQQAPQIGLYFKTNALVYDTKVTVSENLRDINIFTTIPQWYMFVKKPEE